MDGANHPKNVVEAKDAKMLFSTRLTLALMCLFGTLSFMFQRLTINFGLICIVKTITSTTNLSNFDLDLNDTLISTEANIIEDECQFVQNQKNHSVVNAIAKFDQGTFEWSRDTQGLILASFYYGFIISQIPGGILSDRFGAKQGLLWSVALVSLLTLLIPMASNFDHEYLIALRLLQGLANGPSLPAISSLCSRWFADMERGVMLGITYAGICIATAITYPISALFCKFMGWPYLFYFAGSTGLVWSLLMYFLVFDWPENHPRISRRELQFIQKHRSVQYGGETRQKLRIPWLRILISMPVWAVFIANFCCFWSFLTVSMYLPTYLKEVLHLDISENGVLSSIPFVMMMTFHFLVGVWFDRLRQKRLCSVSLLRKIFNTFGCLGSSLCMALIGVISCSNRLGAIFLITGGQVLIEFATMGGYLFSIYELAPKFVSILTAVMTTFGLIVGLVSPPLVSYLTPNGSREEWLVVFYIAAAINGFGGIFYLVFGSSELQSWAGETSTDAGDENRHTKSEEMKVLHNRLVQEVNK